MQFVVFDLEATCWDGNMMGREQEVIEIGALSIDMYGDKNGEFKRLVRPVANPNLSHYCTKLTGITQDDVNTARSFGQVGQQFEDWIYDIDEEYLLCSWGDKDLEFLQSDCRRHKLDTDWLEHYIDLKAQYHKIKRIQRKKGLKRVLQAEGFEFEGSHHRAFDDALNLSNIFIKYRDQWMY